MASLPASHLAGPRYGRTTADKFGLKFPQIHQQTVIGPQRNGLSPHADDLSGIPETFNQQPLDHLGQRIDPVGAGIVIQRNGIVTPVISDAIPAVARSICPALRLIQSPDS